MTDKNEEPDQVPDLFNNSDESQGDEIVSFEDRLSRLEDIVTKMERGGLTLAESMTLYEEGTAHLAALNRTLGRVREQVVKLVSDENGESTLESYTGEDTL